MNIKLTIKLFLIFTIIGLQACVKKDPVSTLAQVLLVPLSPNATAVDFSIDNNIVATGVGYSTTTGTIRYTLPYYSIVPKGATTIAYKANGFEVVRAAITKDMKDEDVYSTFLIDSAAKARAVIVVDNLNEPNPGKVKIRFFNFAPNAPALDVTIMGATTKLFTARAFNDQDSNKDLQAFIEIDPGTYTFVFTNATTGAMVYTTNAQVLLVDRIYTLAARGFVGGIGTQAIGAWVYPNKP